MLCETRITERPAVASCSNLTETLRLKRGVTNGEHLVEKKYLRVKVRGDRKRQPNEHPARIALHRRVEESLHSGEVDDRVETPFDLPGRVIPRIAPFR